MAATETRLLVLRAVPLFDRSAISIHLWSAGEPTEWGPAADDPGRQMAVDAERYRSLPALHTP